MTSYSQVDTLMSLNDEFKESLCNNLAVAGIENIISTDQSEIWTLLDQQEPENYNYELDAHTDVIEKATTQISEDLFKRINIGFEPFIELVEINDGCNSFWNQFSLLPLTLISRSIDEFNDLMQNILEGLEN